MLLQTQQQCLGHHRRSEKACLSCVAHVACQQQKATRLEEFARSWARDRRIGFKTEILPITEPTPCVHCSQVMRVEDGNMMYVKTMGAYHLPCVDVAFPG